jgi:hypothetical protein
MHIEWDWGLISQGWHSKAMKLTTHLHLVLRLRILELYLHSPICLHGMVLD